MEDRFVSMKEVRARVPFSKPTIYKMMRAGTFPQARRIGKMRIAFLESELLAWMESRETAVGDEG